MATLFTTSSGSEYTVDGSRVKRRGSTESSFDGQWWPIKAISKISVGAVVNFEIVDGPVGSHMFQTGRVDSIWDAGIA